MYRQIVLDTETTGLKVEEGHRLIEIGCLELIDRKLTGKLFHHYLNPEREVEPGAISVHGISNEFLQDKPLFSQIAEDFISFISNAELIIHNAPFDLSFLNHQLRETNSAFKNILEYCKVIDTLKIARQLFVGQRNSLDALCKRFSIDNTKRDYHGALLDAHLLAQVYLSMTGGQGSFFDALQEQPVSSPEKKNNVPEKITHTHPIKLLKATDEEISEHNNYLKKMLETYGSIWVLE